MIYLTQWGCTKTPIKTGITNDPLFNFTGIIGNDSVDFKAGVKGWYMYTDYFKDSQRLWTLQGKFASDSCESCEPSLTFQVKDIETTNGNTLAGEYAEIFSKSVFTSYSLDSIFQNTAVEIFNFEPYIGNPVGTTYNWDFGDGTTSTLSNPSHVFPALGERNVQLICSSGNWKDTMINTLDATYGSTCRLHFNVDTTSADSITFNAPVGYNSYTWFLGNGFISTQQDVLVNYPMPGIYNISLQTTKDSCSSAMQFNWKIPYKLQQGSYCLANYDYSTTFTNQLIFQPRINKNVFIITYKKDGKTYNSWKPSKNLDQSNIPVFTLLGFNLYIPNEKNLSTMKVIGSVDTYLYNKDNAMDSIRIKSTSMNFAVAFPR